jgi:hypothetical protein
MKKQTKARFKDGDKIEFNIHGTKVTGYVVTIYKGKDRLYVLHNGIIGNDSFWSDFVRFAAIVSVTKLRKREDWNSIRQGGKIRHTFITTHLEGAKVVK